MSKCNCKCTCSNEKDSVWVINHPGTLVPHIFFNKEEADKLFEGFNRPRKLDVSFLEAAQRGYVFPEVKE